MNFSLLDWFISYADRQTDRQTDRLTLGQNAKSNIHFLHFFSTDHLNSEDIVKGGEQ